MKNKVSISLLLFLVALSDRNFTAGEGEAPVARRSQSPQMKNPLKYLAESAASVAQKATIVTNKSVASISNAGKAATTAVGNAGKAVTTAAGKGLDKATDFLLTGSSKPPVNASHTVVRNNLSLSIPSRDESPEESSPRGVADVDRLSPGLFASRDRADSDSDDVAGNKKPKIATALRSKLQNTFAAVEKSVARVADAVKDEVYHACDLETAKDRDQLFQEKQVATANAGQEARNDQMNKLQDEMKQLDTKISGLQNEIEGHKDDMDENYWTAYLTYDYKNAQDAHTSASQELDVAKNELAAKKSQLEALQDASEGNIVLTPEQNRQKVINGVRKIVANGTLDWLRNYLKYYVPKIINDQDIVSLQARIEEINALKKNLHPDDDKDIIKQIDSLVKLLKDIPDQTATGLAATGIHFVGMYRSGAYGLFFPAGADWGASIVADVPGSTSKEVSLQDAVAPVVDAIHKDKNFNSTNSPLLPSDDKGEVIVRTLLNTCGKRTDEQKQALALYEATPQGKLEKQTRIQSIQATQAKIDKTKERIAVLQDELTANQKIVNEEGRYIGTEASKVTNARDQIVRISKEINEKQSLVAQSLSELTTLQEAHGIDFVMTPEQNRQKVIDGVRRVMADGTLDWVTNYLKYYVPKIINDKDIVSLNNRITELEGLKINLDPKKDKDIMDKIDSVINLLKAFPNKTALGVIKTTAHAAGVYLGGGYQLFFPTGADFGASVVAAPSGVSQSDSQQKVATA